MSEKRPRSSSSRKLDAALRAWRWLDVLHLAFALLSFAALNYVIWRLGVFADLPNDRPHRRAQALILLPFLVLAIAPYAVSWVELRRQFEDSDRTGQSYLLAFPAISILAIAAFVAVNWSGLELLHTSYVACAQCVAYVVALDKLMPERWRD